MPSDTQPPSPIRRWIAIALFIAVALGATLSSYLVFKQINHLPRTTDASIEAEMVHISSGLPGRVVKVAIVDNQSVTKGQLLFSLDTTSYQLLKDQATANLELSYAALADAKRISKATAENSATADVEIQRAQSLLDLAEATVKRLTPLAAEGITSQQELDVALTAVANARVSLQETKHTSKSAKYLIKSTDALEAGVRVAKATLALAEHNLSKTQIRAPFDGKITGLTLTEGTWVLPSVPLFTLINTESWHAVGFFKETELASIKPGQPIRIRVQSNPDTILTGKVESIGWGVLSTDSITLKGVLPFVPTSNNWVRLAKRYPVKVSIDPFEVEDSENLNISTKKKNSPRVDWLRVGASATLALQPDATTKTSDEE